MDSFFASAIKNIVKCLEGSSFSKSVAFTDVAPLLARIQDPNLALAIAKWLAKELCNGTQPTPLQSISTHVLTMTHFLHSHMQSPVVLKL